MLKRLRMCIEDCIAEHKGLLFEMFHHARTSLGRSVFSKRRPIYGHEPFHKALQSIEARYTSLNKEKRGNGLEMDPVRCKWFATERHHLSLSDFFQHCCFNLYQQFRASSKISFLGQRLCSKPLWEICRRVVTAPDYFFPMQDLQIEDLAALQIIPTSRGHMITYNNSSFKLRPLWSIHPRSTLSSA